MKIIDGRKIAEAEKEEVRKIVQTLTRAPRLRVITCAPNLATESYLQLKQRTAEALGISLAIVALPEYATTKEVIAAVKTAVKEADGVVVQLPLPPSIKTDEVLLAIPRTHDPDNFRYTGEAHEVLPPVVYAIDLIAKQEEVVWKDKTVVVFGAGRLVGAPVLLYAEACGAHVSVVTEKIEEGEAKELTKKADIIVLGVGKPRLITPEWIKEGALVFDAGASEDGGVLVGDAAPEVALVAGLFTPVPGGIGPITVVALFRNLLKLAFRQ